MQGAQVQSLVRELTIHHMNTATKSLHAATKEPAGRN